MTRWLTPPRLSSPAGRRISNGRYAPRFLPIGLPLSQIFERELTDSKRTTHDACLEAVGSLKSLRYQPTPPRNDCGLSSPTFHALGTVTGFQPAVPDSRWGPL